MKEAPQINEAIELLRREAESAFMVAQNSKDPAEREQCRHRASEVWFAVGFVAWAFDLIEPKGPRRDFDQFLARLTHDADQAEAAQRETQGGRS